MPTNFVNAATRTLASLPSALATYLTSNSLTSVLITKDEDTYKIALSGSTVLISKLAPETAAGRDSYSAVTSDAELAALYDFLAGDGTGAVDMADFIATDLGSLIAADVMSFDTFSITAETADVATLTLGLLDGLGETPTGKGPYSGILILVDNGSGDPVVAGTIDAATDTLGTVDSHNGNLVTFTTDANGDFKCTLTDTAGGSDVTVGVTGALLSTDNDGVVGSASVVFDAIDD